MKKFISGLNAKFALAVLAVSSVFMTACYEKPEPSPVVEPVPAAYYITGTVSDGTTGAAVAGVSVKIDGAAVTVSNGSFQKQVAGPGEYDIFVSAENYLDVTRTVQVVAVGDDQVSITSVDIAIFSASCFPAEVTPAGAATLSASELAALGFENAEILEDGMFAVTEVGEIEATDMPFEVSFNEKSGFIFTPAVATKAIDETAYVGEALSQATNMPFFNNSFKDVAKKATIGGNGRMLVGYELVRTYKMEDYAVVMYDATEKTFTVINEVNCVVKAIYDAHDNHDNHDNHHGGATAVGGGLANEQ